MIPLVLFVLPALSLGVAVDSDPLHFPLTRRSPGPRDDTYLSRIGDSLRHKYGFDTVQKRQTASDVPITNQHSDSSYFGAVNVGTPPQSLNVILDTGSADLWVASTSCQTCTAETPLFDPTKSSSFQTTAGPAGTVDIQYGSGEVSGQLSSDVINMGGFTINGQTFLSVDQTSNGLLDGPVSGIMGFGFQAIASSQAVPFWQTLLDNQQFSSPLFSFYLTRFGNVNSATVLEPGGVLTLGGTNTSLYQGDIDFVNMPNTATPSFWLLDLTSLSIGGNDISISASTSLAAIDTGTTLIGGPSADVRRFWAAVPGSQALTGNNAGYYTFPCSTKLDVKIAFGGKTWSINNDDMLIQTSQAGLCVGAIFDLQLGSNAGGGRGNPNWVVGDSFLKNVYSVYRATPPSIGFAQLAGAGGGSGSPAVSVTSTISSTPSTSTKSRSTSTVIGTGPGSGSSSSTAGDPAGTTSPFNSALSGKQFAPSAIAISLLAGYLML